MEILVLWCAAGLAMVTFAVHTFIGGIVVARPLLADTRLPAASKWLNYYCWHIATLTILAIAAAFAYSAIREDRPEGAVFGTAFAAALSALSAAVAVKGNIHPLRFPSTSLFAGIAVLGVAALL